MNSSSRINRWRGCSAIISGGSAGLGLALAKQLAPVVSRLVIVGRSAERLESAASELRSLVGQLGSNSEQSPLELIPVAADVATSEGSQRLASQLQTFGGKFDLLINAVGQSDRGVILELTPDRLHELIDANVTSTLLTTQVSVGHLAKGGAIVNIGSLAGHFAPRYLGGYAIAKHALAGLTQQMRLELAERDLHVLHVCPGPIRNGGVEPRYAGLESAKSIPAEALKGGGGAKIRGLDPDRLAEEILVAAARGKTELIRPFKVRLLIWISALWPRLGEWILRRSTS